MSFLSRSQGRYRRSLEEGTVETWSPVPEASWAAMGQLVAVSQDTERPKQIQGDGARAALSQQLAGRDPGCVGKMTRPHLSQMPGTDSRCLRWSMTKVTHDWGHFLSGFTLVPDPSQAGLGRVSWPLHPMGPPPTGQWKHSLL